MFNKSVLFSAFLAIGCIISIIACNSKKVKEEVYTYEDGSAKAKFTTVDGQIEGLYEEFYPGGNLMGKKNFVGNKEQGVAYTYFHSGEVKEVQYFLD